MYSSMEKCKEAEAALIKMPCANILATPLNNKRIMCLNNKRHGRKFLLAFEIVKKLLFLFTYQ